MPKRAIYGDRRDKTRLHAHIPTTMYEQLAERAKHHHRTLTREVIAIVDEVLQRDEQQAEAIVAR